jgi:hypothetical protein
VQPEKRMQRKRGSLLKAIVRLLRRGELSTLIAERLDCHQSYVSRVRAQQGFPPVAASESRKLGWVVRRVRASA